MREKWNENSDSFLLHPRYPVFTRNTFFDRKKKGHARFEKKVARMLQEPKEKEKKKRVVRRMASTTMNP